MSTVLLERLERSSTPLSFRTNLNECCYSWTANFVLYCNTNFKIAEFYQTVRENPNPISLICPDHAVDVPVETAWSV